MSQTYEKPLSWARITNDRKCRVALGRLQRLVTRRASPERRRDHTAPDALQELEIRPGRSCASALPPPDQTETPPPTCNRAAPRGSGVTAKLKRPKCVKLTYEKSKLPTRSTTCDPKPKALGRLQRLVTQRPSPERRRDAADVAAWHTLEKRPCRSRACESATPHQTEATPPFGTESSSEEAV